MTGLQIAEKIYNAADDKKASDILVFDMEGVADVTDYYLICSANTDIQVRAIADNIEDELAKIGMFAKSKEGYSEGSWVLMDYGYCVVHIFKEAEREYYNLEKLWARAGVVDFLDGKE